MHESMPITRILLDNNVSRRLCPLLLPYEVVHASQAGWAELRNGDLLRAAEEHGFDVLVTGDRNMRYQQNLTRVRFSIIELSSQHWPTIRDNVAELVATIEAIAPGAYAMINFPRPFLRRRAYPRLDC